MSQIGSCGTVIEFKCNGRQFEVDIGLSDLVDAVKGKKKSLFLQI